MSEIDYAARVAKGVALLDDKRPGWERELDLGTLDIASSTSCVTAQLGGERDYFVGMRQLELTEGNDGTYVAYGFNVENCERDCFGPNDDDCPMRPVYAILNSLWRDVVTERLTASPEAAS